MSMTSLLAQEEEGRAFVEAAEVSLLLTFFLLEQEHHNNGLCFENSNPALLQTRTAAQLHGAYFKCEDEDERDTNRVSQLDAFEHLDSSLGAYDNNDNDARGGHNPLAFVIQRKRERRKKLAIKAMKKLFPSLYKGIVTRSNKLNKGYLCLKWHSATKARRAQHLVKSVDPGYRWKIEVARDPTAKPPALPPTPDKIEEADLLNTLDWLVAPGEFKAQHKLPPTYKDDNHFKQD
eukprot:jgi/Psemu1/26385/gm1.26385_g